MTKNFILCFILRNLLWHRPVVWFNMYPSQQNVPRILRKRLNSYDYSIIETFGFLLQILCFQRTYPKHKRFSIHWNKPRDMNTIVKMNIIGWYQKLTRKCCFNLNKFKIISFQHGRLFLLLINFFMKSDNNSQVVLICWFINL